MKVCFLERFISAQVYAKCAGWHDVCYRSCDLLSPEPVLRVHHSKQSATVLILSITIIDCCWWLLPMDVAYGWKKMSEIIQFIWITLSNMSQCLCEIPLWQKSHLISFGQSFPYLHVICIMLPKQLKALDKDPYNDLIPTLLCTASLICLSLSCYLLICVRSEKAPAHRWPCSLHH